MTTSSPPPPRHRVLVVDDSAFARKVLREILSADDRLEVVGFARDGLDALEKIDELRPDVVTLDLVMPELDGVGVLEALNRMGPPPPPHRHPRVVIVTMTDVESAKGVAALAAGAFEIVHKPTALATDRLYELARELVEKVVLAARSRTMSSAAARIPPSTTRVTSSSSTTTPPKTPAMATARLVVIGASTGGPRALTEILSALPATFPVPIAAVVHMPEGYTAAFAARLNAGSKLRVTEAVEGQRLEPGVVLLARAGVHLRVRKDRLSDALTVSLGGAKTDRDATLHCPSVDVLFESAANALDKAVVGVVLTGMGTDGLLGAKEIHRVGGKLIVEAESSCVVYGMPRAIAEANLGAFETPLDRIPRAILDRL